ncbi:hypothetical protein [Polynucleobacter sp.]|jgi:hypothetical protein|uniref:hypothetical protein n=1 Tax=Polynucleobacter sp. TaxID=2029855 RepID=UPI0037C53F9C
MQSKMLKIIIGIVLVLFVFFSILISGVCQLTQNNSAPTNPVVSTVSNALSVPNPIQKSAPPDPFSWEPVLHQLLQFFSKACPR